MQEINVGSFLCRFFYGVIVAGIAAMMIRNYLEAQFKSTFRKRSLDKFPDSAQPTLTPDVIIESSFKRPVQLPEFCDNGWPRAGLFVLGL